MCVFKTHGMYIKIHIPSKIIFGRKKKYILCEFIYTMCETNTHILHGFLKIYIPRNAFVFEGQNIHTM